MKKVVFAVAAVAVAVLFALPSFADEAKTKAEKPTHHDYTGTITVLDAAKGTLTIAKKQGETKDFTVTDKAVATLADLKVGEKVKVTYTEDAGKNTATKIAPVTEKAKTPVPAQTTK